MERREFETRVKKLNNFSDSGKKKVQKIFTSLAMEDVVLAAEHGFTDYELVRIGRIERNNARLLQLGLISKHEADVSNARAKGIEVVEESDRDDSASGSEYGDDDDDDDGEFLEGKKRRAAQGKKKKRKKSIEKDSVPRAPTRNSRRLQGQAPDGTVYDITLPRTAEEIALERESRVEVCREARLKAANQVRIRPLPPPPLCSHRR